MFAHFKGKLCKSFMSNGNCVIGSSYQFAHGNTELMFHGMGDGMTTASKGNHSNSELIEGTTSQQYKTKPSMNNEDSDCQNTFRCIACSEFHGQYPSFQTFREVYQHSLLVHRVSLMSAVQSATLLPDKLVMYQCKLCKESYFSETSVKIHLETHWDLLVSKWKEYTEVKCRVCEVVIERDGMEEHMNNLHPSDQFANTQDLEEKVLHGYEPNSLKSTTSQLKIEKQDTPPSIQTTAAAYNTALPTRPLIRVKPLSLLQAQSHYQPATSDDVYAASRSPTTNIVLEPAIFRTDSPQTPTSQVWTKKCQIMSPNQKSSYKADNKKGGISHRRTSPRNSRTSSYRSNRRSLSRSSRESRRSPSRNSRKIRRSPSRNSRKSRRSPSRNSRKSRRSSSRNSRRSQIRLSKRRASKSPSKTQWYKYRDGQGGSSRGADVGKKLKRGDGDRNRRSRSKDSKSGGGIQNCSGSSDGH